MLHLTRSMIYTCSVLCTLCNSYVGANAQTGNSTPDSTLSYDSSKSKNYYRHQVDLIDLGIRLVQGNPDLRLRDFGAAETKLRLSVGPIVEYTISTGFTGGVSAGGAFLTTDKVPTKVSSVLFAIKYTEKKQFLLPVQTSFWLPGNSVCFNGDWRFLKYPQNTYGFGGYTTLNDVSTVSYNYIRFYETGLKRIATNLYAGPGYQLDYHTNITQGGISPGQVTDFSLYGLTQTSTSSGLTFSVNYDSRKNSINPEGGSFYANLMYLQDLKILASDHNTNAVLIDIRKYFKLSPNFILAFWTYGYFTLSGNPPYLDLPGTGSDTYGNTGRGYELGRFIGKKMLYGEAEIRFGITKNGLLGGVVFINAESLSELQSNKFEVISPAAGLGLRIKFNKFSNTNACLDYGVGKNGSRGFSGNLGEVF